MESLVSDIPAGDGKTANLFLQSSSTRLNEDWAPLLHPRPESGFPCILNSGRYKSRRRWQLLIKKINGYVVISPTILNKLTPFYVRNSQASKPEDFQHLLRRRFESIVHVFSWVMTKYRAVHRYNCKQHNTGSYISLYIMYSMYNYDDGCLLWLQSSESCVIIGTPWR